MHNGLITIFFYTSLFSQELSNESVKWYNANLNGYIYEPDWGISIDKKELKNYYQNYDFYYIWMIFQRMNFGFIGENYNKFDIKFTSIFKSNTDKLLYNVKGKTRVCNMIFYFTGTIKIKNIRKLNYEENETSILNENYNFTSEEITEIYKNKKFIILSEWYLKAENGVLGDISGIMVSKIYDRKGFIYYDDLEFESDNYSNNQFVGEWKNYKLKPNDKYRCNWGDNRIPYSGDLNTSCSDFCPDEKYLKYGWENYYNAVLPYDSIAYEKEMNW